MRNLLVVGEAPNQASLVAGRPFVGRAGDYLRARLADVGIAPEAWTAINAVPALLHRRPTDGEVLACAWVVREVIERCRPAVVLCLGSSAILSVLGRQGKLHEVVVRGATTVVTTYHPSYASRFRNVRSGDSTVAQVFRRDLKRVARFLQAQDQSQQGAAPSHLFPNPED